jgi:uncharacterized membrane protein
VRRIIHTSGKESLVARAIGSDRKGNLSLLMYVVAVSSAFAFQWVAFALYVAVALIWLVPDRRIARAIEHHPGATRPD